MEVAELGAKEQSAREAFQQLQSEKNLVEGELNEKLLQQQRQLKRSMMPRTKQTFIKNIFGKKFTIELMSEVHLRLYNYSETEQQDAQRAEFKTEFSSHYKAKLAAFKESNTNPDFIED